MTEERIMAAIIAAGMTADVGQDRTVKDALSITRKIMQRTQGDGTPNPIMQMAAQIAAGAIEGIHLRLRPNEARLIAQNALAIAVAIFGCFSHDPDVDSWIEELTQDAANAIDPPKD